VDAKLDAAVRLLAEKLGITPDELGDVTIIVECGTVNVHRPPLNLMAEYNVETDDDD
jgi:hypothetical protein